MPIAKAALPEIYGVHCHLATPKHNPRCIHCGRPSLEGKLLAPKQDSVARELVQENRLRGANGADRLLTD